MSLLYFLVERGWKIEEVLALPMAEAAVYQGIAAAHFEIMANRGGF